MGIVREGAGFLIRRVIMGREIPIEEWKEEDCVCFQM